MAPQKINIKERVSDGEIDLSMSDLQDVPVKDIAVFKKAVSLDLSNNHLKSLPANFATLTHLTKLDLSKNELAELPEDFGELVKLKYLDLYQNKLQYLPLSFSKLKSLKWLDLKDNPLVPAVAKVAGQCLDAKQCQSCAKDVVSFFTQVQEQVASDLENRQKQRQKQLEANQQKQMEAKKNKRKEKPKPKKENGPAAKENAAKPPNKKHKKPPSADKQPEKPSCRCKSFVGFFVFSLLVLFILTSVNFEYTRVLQKTCVDLFHQAFELSPPSVQVYLVKVGVYVSYAHEKTGNVTLEFVNYVKNTDNFVNAYDAVGVQIEGLMQKVKEQYEKIVS